MIDGADTGVDRRLSKRRVGPPRFDSAASEPLGLASGVFVGLHTGRRPGLHTGRARGAQHRPNRGLHTAVNGFKWVLLPCLTWRRPAAFACRCDPARRWGDRNWVICVISQSQNRDLRTLRMCVQERWVGDWSTRAESVTRPSDRCPGQGTASAYARRSRRETTAGACRDSLQQWSSAGVQPACLW